MSDGANDPLRVYLAAGTRYKAAREAAKAKVDLLSNVVDTAKYGFPTFLAEGFGLSYFRATDRSYTRRDRRPIDMRQWPDREQLKQVMTELHEAFSALHGAWADVPRDLKTSPGMSSPPDVLRID